MPRISVRRYVADNAARSSLDEVARGLRKVTGSTVPKRQVEQLAERAAQDFDAFHATRAVEKDRMDRTGARWSLRGAEAVLRLRSLRSSGDFEAYWALHMQQEYDRTLRARYAGGDVPSPLPPPRPKLRRVK